MEAKSLLEEKDSYEFKMFADLIPSECHSLAMCFLQLAKNKVWQLAIAFFSVSHSTVSFAVLLYCCIPFFGLCCIAFLNEVAIWMLFLVL